MRKREHKKEPGSPSNSGPFISPRVQPKLKVGEANDHYEKEADQMASHVVSTSNSDALQKKGTEEEVQQKPLASEVTPFVQKMEGTEEEAVQKAQEEEPVQKMEDEESVQKVSEEDPVQKAEDEEVAQGKEASKSGTIASQGIESRINRSKGGGNKLDAKTKNEMESGFGNDFSNVNIHTDKNAVNLSQDLGAKAFTHGNDVYFNERQFDPRSNEGKHLLAHELTHTIQQKGTNAVNVQKMELNSPRFQGNSQLQEVLDGNLLIKKGNKGAHVRIIQQALLDAGFALPKYGVDGDFGSETKAAIRAFQLSQGLSSSEQDGVVGKQTMEELDKKYTGYTTEHGQIVGDTDTDVLGKTREITDQEKVDVADAISTEVKVDPATGLKPVFDVANSTLYKKELKDLTEKIALRQYDALGKGKQALRADPANLHDPKDIDSVAVVSKEKTDAVFGGIKQGPPLEFGVNIFDGWEDKQKRLVGKSSADQDAIQTGWAEWRIQKIVEGPSMGPINEKYGADQSRAPEAAIVQQVIDELSVTYRAEMIQTHLGWPGFASDGEIFLQRYKSSDNVKNREFMWDNFGTIIHEYIHTLEHPDAIAYRNGLSEKGGGKVLREGITDYFTKIVWNNINFMDHALRKRVEGPFYDGSNNEVPTNGYYEEANNAERMAGIVGTNNVMGYFFLGKTELIIGS